MLGLVLLHLFASDVGKQTPPICKAMLDSSQVAEAAEVYALVGGVAEATLSHGEIYG